MPFLKAFMRFFSIFAPQNDSMIEKIAIKNFKSIREMDLLLRPINILIGGNGGYRWPISLFL